MLTSEWAMNVSTQWCDAWNKRDIDALMALYADDAELNSPLVAKRWGVAHGWIRGKEHLRKNFEIGMQTPGMYFTLEHVLLGQRSFCIFYTRENGSRVCDLFELNEMNQLLRIVACHAPPNTAKP